MGVTLPHEHIMVDFVGADKTGKHRYDPADVVRIMIPFVEEIAALGVQTLVECTPAYLARDPEILKSLSESTGIHFLTNIGWYKEPFLPPRAFELNAEQIAEEWIAEFENGIGGTGIRPGFIKTAVNPGSLIPVQRTITEAAVLAAKNTGLTVATHTGAGIAAHEILDIFEAHSVAPDRWIFVHAQNEENLQVLASVAARGAWIELDGLGPDSADQHIKALRMLLDLKREKQVLLSHDAGWYNVGEQNGGTVRPFTYLFTDFLPRLRAEGLSEELIKTFLVHNPARAFSYTE